MLSNYLRDLHYTVRHLRQNLGFAAAAVLTTALGIGLNTGVFSVLNGVALRPVPTPDADALVSIYQEIHGAGRRSVHGAPSMFSTSEYRAYRDSARTLSAVAGYSLDETLTVGGAAPEEVHGIFVTCNYFDVLQIRPAIGTGFTAANCDDAPPPSSVVLSYDLWRNKFGADPQTLGAVVTINRNSFTVVGIAPEGFNGTEIFKESVFVPISAQAVLGAARTFYSDDRLSWLALIGRKRTGIELGQVRTDLRTIARTIDQLYPGRQTALSVSPATVTSLPEARRLAFSIGGVVLAAFALILMIACANVANLLLARAATRTQEIAVRMALGASRGRLIQQLLTESMLIALLGGALGSLFALSSFESLLAFIVSSLPGNIPPLSIDSSPDWKVWAFAIAAAGGAGLLFGLAPALQASKQDLHSTLKQERARRTTGLLRSGLVAVQVALCATLMISAGLLLRALYTAQTVDPGFAYQNIAVASFDLTGAGYTAEKAAAFQQDLLVRASTLPGVDRTGLALKTPLSPGRMGAAVQLPGDERWRNVDYNNVSPEYFALLEIPIVRGRAFTEDDLRDDSSAAIITEATAARYWPGREPIGQTMDLVVGRNQKARLEVVGVARDAEITGIGEKPSTYLYLPAVPRSAAQVQLLVRSRTNFASTAAAIRAAVRDLDPQLVVRVSRLEDNLDYWRAMSRFAASLSASLGALALVLASIGVYGVVSFIVVRRIRETGIRIALGATTRDIRNMMLKQTMRPVVIGMLIGAGAAAGTSRVFQAVLFGVSPFDPIAFIAAPLFLAIVAVAATLRPIRRATRVDPILTLRCD